MVLVARTRDLANAFYLLSSVLTTFTACVYLTPLA